MCLKHIWRRLLILGPKLTKLWGDSVFHGEEHRQARESLCGCELWRGYFKGKIQKNRRKVYVPKNSSTYNWKIGHTYTQPPPKSRVLFTIKLSNRGWQEYLAIADAWVVAFTCLNIMAPVRFPVECHTFLKKNRLHFKCSCLNDPLFPVFTSTASYAHGPLTVTVPQILIYPAAATGSPD